jgi:hypothetical protein
MCDPAPHPNCETYTELEIVDPATGESRYVDVCMEHYEAVKP